MERQGFTVTTARNGYEALEIIQNRLENQQDLFSLVILDINMPIMGGYESCKAINNLFDGKKILKLKNSNLNNKQSSLIDPKENESSVIESMEHSVCSPVIIGYTCSMVSSEMLNYAK